MFVSVNSNGSFVWQFFSFFIQRRARKHTHNRLYSQYTLLTMAPARNKFLYWCDALTLTYNRPGRNPIKQKLSGNNRTLTRPTKKIECVSIGHFYPTRITKWWTAKKREQNRDEREVERTPKKKTEDCRHMNDFNAWSLSGAHRNTPENSICAQRVSRIKETIRDEKRLPMRARERERRFFFALLP